MNSLNILKNLDDNKITKLGKTRENWLKSPHTKENIEVIDQLTKDNINAKISSITSENYNHKKITIKSLENNSFPQFKAGQKISVTVKIDDKFYMAPFSLASNPAKSFVGEYTIIVKKDENNQVSNYLFKDAIKDEPLSISYPFGNFYYQPLRDKKNVIAIVSDQGIIPIISMTQAIISGLEDFNLTIFYSEKNDSDFLFKDELLEYAELSNKIKINFVLNYDKETNTKKFISFDMINKVYKEKETSIFIAGSEGLLKHLDNELKDFNLPKKFIRYDNFLPTCNIKKVIKYNLTVYLNDIKYEIPCYNNKTIMKSLIEAGGFIPNKCQNGSCGLCRSELVKGEVKIINDKRIKSDKLYNYIHPCSTYPLSDIEIIVR